MTPEKREEIGRLAADMHEKQSRFLRIGRSNIAHLSYEEAKKATIEYEIARAEYLEARSALDAAMPHAQSALARQQEEGLRRPIARSNGGAY